MIFIKAFVTGGAGCIGSELAARLLNEGHGVVVFDNLSSGKLEHIKDLIGSKKFRFVKGSILNLKLLAKSMKGCDFVFHLAANSFIKFKAVDPTDNDLKHNTIGTYNVLEAMRLNGIKKIAFTSTSPIYGEAKKVPTPENYGPLETISLYAASKVAGETLISSFSHMFGMQSWIFRIANTVGGKSRKVGGTIISDFIEKLRKNPKELEILGNGRQSKSYMTVDDCIDGMLYGIKHANDTVNIFNVGSDDSVTINEIARIVIDEMGLKDAKIKYSGGDRGWVGDVPKFQLSVEKINRLGWKAKHTSKEAVRIAARQMLGIKAIP